MKLRCVIENCRIASETEPATDLCRDFLKNGDVYTGQTGAKLPHETYIYIYIHIYIYIRCLARQGMQLII